MNYKRLLKAFGPAWLVMIANVDIASIVEGIQSGISWGYHMIFIMLILTIPLFFIQYLAGNLGTISGKGLGEAIRIKYGSRKAVFASMPMAITDFLEYVIEYAGIAIGLQLLGFPLIIGLPLFYVLHIAIVTSKKYEATEKFLLPVSFVLVATIIVLSFSFPINFYNLFKFGLNPIQPYANPSYLYLMAASIGAVIMPWMLFFHSGADARKTAEGNIKKHENLETLIGAIVSEVLMIITVIFGCNMRKIDPPVVDRPELIIDASLLHKIFIGISPSLNYIMAIGFIASGFLALIIISMASAWGTLEALNVRSHKAYLIIYSTESLPAIFMVLIIRNLIYLMIELMVIYIVILIPLLYFLGKTASDPIIMKGKEITGVRLKIYWIISALVIFAGLLGLVSSLP